METDTKTATHLMDVMNAMVSQCFWEDNLKHQNKSVFRRRIIGDDDGDAMHGAIHTELERENDGLKVKAELFALLYICQPEALFRRRRLTRTVKYYTVRLMGLGVATTSAQKQNLAFLYFNDKVFRAIAIRAVNAATNAIDKENAPSK